MEISLGCFDTDVTQGACKAYQDEVERITRLRLSEVSPGVDRIELRQYTPDVAGAQNIAAVQRALTSLGFFPGGKADGICGYRTQSAIRLFQEYVRSVEKLDCLPDGCFGPKSQQHLQRWQANGIVPNWSPTVERWKQNTLASTEYTEWLALLGKVKERCLAAPNRMLQMVNAFGKATDTRKVAQWDFPQDRIHLVGIRRESASGKFDDIFVLLLKGLVYKFQGSTEPGASSDPRGTPFLVQGQHDYHFGWHRKTYLALRPQGAGVLVVRSKGDMRLEEADLAGGLEANGSINIHWGGKGLKADVRTWSEGCQVINGSLYLNANNELIDCSSFAALNQTELNTNRRKTRGAYNVLVDLVTALGSDIPGDTIRYTLLAEQDLDLAPGLKQSLAETSARVVEKLS